jgi:hypothetical protein
VACHARPSPFARATGRLAGWARIPGKTERRKEAFSLCALAMTAGVVGILMRAWTGPLKGDDVFFHLGNIRFIASNFPHIWWFPYSHSGEPLFLSYPMLPYLTLAGLANAGIDPPTAFRWLLFLSLVGVLWSGYWLARSLGLGRPVAVALTLLVFGSPSFWTWSLVGGAYLRVTAVPFLFASVAAAVRYIRNLELLRDTRGSYLLLVASLGATALIHPLVFQFTLVIVVSLLTVGIAGWWTRGRVIGSVLVWVGTLTAWQYVPLISNLFGTGQSIQGAPRHDTTPLPLASLYSLPSTGKFNLGPGSALFVVGVAAILYVIIDYPRLRRHVRIPRHLFAIIITSVVFSIFFVLFGWARMPTHSYLMAAYDYATWSVFTLTMLAMAVVALIRWTRGGVRHWTRGGVRQGMSWLGIVLSVLAILPAIAWVRTFSSPSGDPRQLASSSHATAKGVSLAASLSNPGFRLGAVDRAATRWMNYEYPKLQFLGGRSADSPNRYFYEWMLSDVFFRLDRPRLHTVYFEDRPHVVPDSIGPLRSYYPSMFWMDWFGTDAIVFDLPFYPEQSTANGYEVRPQFFRYFKAGTRYGPVAVATYAGATPMAELAAAPTVAMPYMAGDSPAYYTDFIELLASLDLDSRYVIPIKLTGGDDLSRFDAALVDYSTYREHRSSLEDYVRKGGYLAITGYATGRIRNQRIHSNHGISIGAPVDELPFAQPERVFATDSQGAVGACHLEGQGTICALGISLEALRNSGEAEAPLLLLDALSLPYATRSDPPSRLPEITFQQTGTLATTLSGMPMASREQIRAEEWRLGFLGNDDEGLVEAIPAGVDLHAAFGNSASVHQANFTAFLGGHVSMSSASLVSFEARTADKVNLDLSFQQGGAYDDYPVQLAKNHWTHYVVPVSAFQPRQGKVESPNQLSFVLTPASPRRAHRSRPVTLRIKNLRVTRVREGGTSNLIQIVVDPAMQHNQANLAFKLKRAVPAGTRGLVTFRIWNDGVALKNLAVTLVDVPSLEFLQYIIPSGSWFGFREFAIPLGAFTRNENWHGPDLRRIDFAFNFDPPYEAGSSKAYTFAVDAVKVITIPSAPRPADLSGRWLDPTRFDLRVPALDPHEGVLWKENFSSSWHVTLDNKPLDFYFAGPGMVFVPIQGSGVVRFQMSLPPAFVGGTATSLTLGVVGVVGLVLRRRRRRRRRE